MLVARATIMCLCVLKAILSLKGVRRLILVKLQRRLKVKSGSATVKPAAAGDLVKVALSSHTPDPLNQDEAFCLQQSSRCMIRKACVVELLYCLTLGQINLTCRASL